MAMLMVVVRSQNLPYAFLSLLLIPRSYRHRSASVSHPTKYHCQAVFVRRILSPRSPSRPQPAWSALGPWSSRLWQKRRYVATTVSLVLVSDRAQEGGANQTSFSLLYAMHPNKLLTGHEAPVFVLTVAPTSCCSARLQAFLKNATLQALPWSDIDWTHACGCKPLPGPRKMNRRCFLATRSLSETRDRETKLFHRCRIPRILFN